MQEVIVYDRPGDRCFGCSQHNEKGLKLRFRKIGEAEVETEFTAGDLYAGYPGVLHGGLQAVLLDEVFGVTLDRGSEADFGHVVTSEFKLRYRRAAPTGAPLKVQGRLARVEGRDHFLEGAIVNAASEVLTEGEALWRRI